MARGLSFRMRRFSLRPFAVAAFVLCIALSAGAGNAQNATWLPNPSSDDFNFGANWSAGSVPTETALFSSSSITDLIFSANTLIGGLTTNPSSSSYTFALNSSVVYFDGTGIIVNGGSATINNNSSFGILGFADSSSAGNAIINNFASGGAVYFTDTSTAANATINNEIGGFLNFAGNSTAGNATISNETDGTLVFTISGSAGDATITNNFDMTFYDTSTGGNATIVNNGQLSFEGESTGGNAAITNNSNGVIDFSTTVGPNNNGKISVGSIGGAGELYLGSNQLTVGSSNVPTTISGVISDCGTGGLACLFYADNGVSPNGGSLVKVGTGTLVLTGTNTYTGATTVRGGLLEVDGSIATSNLTSVTAGGLLTGTGTVGSTQIVSGGVFAPGAMGAPGTAMNIGGNLTLSSGSTYQISLNSTVSTSANVTGLASLGGGMQASFVNGGYISKTYTILTSAGGVTGTFSGVTNVNLPANFRDSLSYDADNAYLDLTLNYQPPPPPSGDQQTLLRLNRNQLAVANTLVNYFNMNGSIPTKFATLPGQGLSQIDGEGNTGAEHSAFQLETQFLNVMLDPFVDGRFGNGGFGNEAVANGSQPLGYTEQRFMPQAMALAYGRVLKGPLPAAYVPHWSAWGAAYGGSSTSDGNAATGSSQLNANTYGFAGGVDYHASADTIVGLSLGGGGTNWGLATVSGSGHSQALQTGVYGITRSGPLYGAADFGFTNNWFTTNRSALGDPLQANFGGQSYGGRVEGGYHLTNLPIGVTPYAAVQTQDFQTPNYSEDDRLGGGFGLSYASMGATDVRTEIGSRFDELTSLDGMPLLLRGKLAWAHDFVSNPSLSAAFESLPGTGFIVDGAPIPHNSALVSTGAELFLTPNWSVQAKFDGEFAGNSQTYGGTGTLRYIW